MLNLKSNRTLWSNFAEGHPSSHYSSPSTLNFAVLSNPSTSSLHRPLLIYLSYQSYYTLLMSRTLFMFMFMSVMKFWKNISNFPVILCIIFWKTFPKKIWNQFFSVTSGPPSKWYATSKFEFFSIFLPLDLESPVTFFLLGFWGFWKCLTGSPPPLNST